jgi:hypothetical protein
MRPSNPCFAGAGIPEFPAGETTVGLTTTFGEVTTFVAVFFFAMIVLLSGG